MKAFIDLLRRTVDKYDEKHGLRKKEIMICSSRGTRNRYKLPEWRTKEGKPLCPIYKNDRCCGGCDIAPSCDHAVNCGCYGFTQGGLGGTKESYYMRKCSPYYKYGRMNEDGDFDWDFYNLNLCKEDFVPGKYAVIKDINKLNLSDETKSIFIDRNFKAGEIVEGLQNDSLLTLNFNKDNNGDDFVIALPFEGFRPYTYYNYDDAVEFL